MYSHKQTLEKMEMKIKKNRADKVNNNNSNDNNNNNNKGNNNNKNCSRNNALASSSGILFEAENPFTLPNDNDIFHLPEIRGKKDENGEQKQKINKEQKKKKPLRAHEKTTYISRMNATNTQIVKVCTR